MSTDFSTLRLFKKSWGRRRFVQSALMDDLLAWEEAALALKEIILMKTNLQIVGSKVVIELRGQNARIMIEVLGFPITIVSMTDLNSSWVMIHPYSKSIFEADFKTLLSTAREIKQKSPHPLEDFFHIVLDNHKIALHFFIQKDYIHASTNDGTGVRAIY